MCVWVISSPGNRIGLRMISSPGDRISLRTCHEYFIHGWNTPSLSVLSFLHSRLTLFSICWNISPYLYFLEVGIVWFVGLPSSFSGLINLYLSGVLVGYKDVVISVSAAALAILSQVLLLRFFYIAIQVIDFWHPTTHCVV